jgi:hypothetical protein
MFPPFRIYCCALVSFLLVTVNAVAQEPLQAMADPALLASAYDADETFGYDISWSGGIKIGELVLRIRKKEGAPDRFELHARVTASGAFRYIYPVDDTFVTEVEGQERLPVRYEVEQNEGLTGSKAHRLTVYDQDKRLVRYRKNDQPEKEFVVDGKVHNEFSSFFFTRVLPFAPDMSVIVSTFADEKRHGVVVTPREWITVEESLLGSVRVVAVLPRMTFKGLYDKAGDTVIWFTDDPCRVPIQVSSKILIGSLVAELVSYHGRSCGRQWDLERKAAGTEEVRAEKVSGD